MTNDPVTLRLNSNLATCEDECLLCQSMYKLYQVIQKEGSLVLQKVEASPSSMMYGSQLSMYTMKMVLRVKANVYKPGLELSIIPSISSDTLHTLYITLMSLHT